MTNIKILSPTLNNHMKSQLAPIYICGNTDVILLFILYYDVNDIAYSSMNVPLDKSKAWHGITENGLGN